MSQESRMAAMMTSLGDSIDWPTPSPHLSTRVISRIDSEQPTAAGHHPWRRPAIALVAVLMVSFVMVVSPSAREAVADVLSAAGIRIGFTSDDAPTAGAGLNLGEPIHLDEAQDAVDFELRIPSGEDPGVPDAVYLNGTGQVTMAWAGTPTLPAPGDTGIGLLLTQSKASRGQEFAEKSIRLETEVRSVTVEGQPALWIEGAAHTFTLSDTEGNPVEETARLAANVLLWEADGVDHRLETTGNLQDSLAIVEMLEPLP